MKNNNRLVVTMLGIVAVVRVNASVWADHRLVFVLAKTGSSTGSRQNYGETTAKLTAVRTGSMPNSRKSTCRSEPRLPFASCRMVSRRWSGSRGCRSKLAFQSPRFN